MRSEVLFVSAGSTLILLSKPRSEIAIRTFRTNGDAGDERRIIIAAPHLGRAIRKPAWLSEGVQPPAAKYGPRRKGPSETFKSF